MKSFFIGVLFISFILPFIDSFSAVVTQVFDLIQTWIAAKTYYIKKAIQDEEDVSGIAKIGFRTGEDD